MVTVDEEGVTRVRDRFVPTIRREVQHRDALVDREARVSGSSILCSGERVDGLLDVAVSDLAHRAEQRLLVADPRARCEHRRSWDRA